MYLRNELKADSQFDVFHNRYFNFTTRHSPKVFIPTRLYRFDDNTPDIKDVTFQFAQSDLVNASAAESLIVVTNTFTLINTLSILQDIQKHQDVYVSSVSLLMSSANADQDQHVDQNKVTTALSERALKFNHRTSSVVVNDANLPREACSHIVQQLQGCTQMTVLGLINVQQIRPLKLNEAISSTLRIINLTHCGLTQDASKALMSGLQHCVHLQHVCLQGNHLANCLMVLFGSSGFPSMLSLNLGYTGLGKADVRAIADAAKQGQLPGLRLLDLTCNILTDCLHNLLPLEPVHPGYVHLEVLQLCGTMLSSTAIAALSQAAQSKRLPSLKFLNLGSNSLTGSIGSLVEDNPGFRSLVMLDLSDVVLDKSDLEHLSKALSNNSFSNCRVLHLHRNKLSRVVSRLFVDAGLPHINVLNLQDAKLCKEDLIRICEAVKSGKLPQLQKLLLFYNDFHGSEDILQNLFEVCAESYKQIGPEIGISLNDVSDPENFAHKIREFCNENNVTVLFNRIEKPSEHSVTVHFEAIYKITVTVGPGPNLLPMPGPDCELQFVLLPPLNYIYEHALSTWKEN